MEAHAAGRRGHDSHEWEGQRIPGLKGGEKASAGNSGLGPIMVDHLHVREASPGARYQAIPAASECGLPYISPEDLFAIHSSLLTLGNS